MTESRSPHHPRDRRPLPRNAFIPPVRAKLPELPSVDWDFGDPQVERPRSPCQGTFHVSEKLCLEQPAAALHGRATLLMSVIAPPDGRDSRRSRRQRAIAGGHPRNVADEQADHQELRLIGTDLPARLIRFMHGSHLSPRENCMIFAWAHVRKAIALQDARLPCGR